jgi:hypothetical protein
MIPVPTETLMGGSVRVWLATGHTDMRGAARLTCRLTCA